MTDTIRASQRAARKPALGQIVAFDNVFFPFSYFGYLLATALRLAFGNGGEYKYKLHD